MAFGEAEEELVLGLELDVELGPIDEGHDSEEKDGEG